VESSHPGIIDIPSRSLSLEQKIGRLDSANSSSTYERRPPIGAWHIDINLLIEEYIHHTDMALFTCMMQSGHHRAIFCFQVCASIDQEFDNGFVAQLCCYMKRSRVPIRSCVDLCFGDE
jgi:hypothetical protein